MHSTLLENCVHCNCSLRNALNLQESFTEIKLCEGELWDEEISVSISEAIFYIYGLSIRQLFSECALSNVIGEEYVEIKSEFPINNDSDQQCALCYHCAKTFTALYSASRSFNKLSSNDSVLTKALNKWCRSYPLVKVENESDTSSEHQVLQDLQRDAQDIQSVCKNEDKDVLLQQYSALNNANRYSTDFVHKLPHTYNKDEKRPVRVKRRTRKWTPSSTPPKRIKGHFESMDSPDHIQLKTLSVVLERLENKSNLEFEEGTSVKPQSSRRRIVWKAMTKKKKTLLKNIRRRRVGQERAKSRLNPNALLYVPYVVCCGTQYTAKTEYLSHTRRCHFGKRLRECCTVCDETPLHHKMGEHMRYYHKPANETTYHCLFCNKIYLEEFLLREHAKSLHLPKNLEAELSSEQDIPLESFGKVYVTANPLKTLEKKSVTKSPCILCGKQITKDGMAYHMDTHSTMRKSYKCRFCDKVYVQKFNLNCHERTHQQNFEPIMCELCGKSVNHKRDLRRHINTCHTAEEYDCTHCGKKMKTKENLRRHEKIHLNILPYVCERCGKPFRVKDKFDRHMRQHLDEELDKELFKCKECNKYMKDSLNLKKHMSRSHGPNMKIFSCELCGKTTKNMTNMRIHYKVHDPTRNIKCASSVKKTGTAKATNEK